jgi:hypothetical protein
MADVGDIDGYLNQSGPSEDVGLVVNLQPTDLIGPVTFLLSQFTGNVPEPLAIAQQAISYLSEIALVVFPPAGILLEVVNLLIDIGEIIAGAFAGLPNNVKTEDVGNRLKASGNQYIHALGQFVYLQASQYDSVLSDDGDIKHVFAPAFKDAGYAARLNAGGFQELYNVIYSGGQIGAAFPKPNLVLGQGDAIEHGPLAANLPPGKVRAVELAWLRYAVYGYSVGATLPNPYTPNYPVVSDALAILQNWENLPKLFKVTLPAGVSGPMLSGDIAMLASQFMNSTNVSDLFTDRGIIYRAILTQAIASNPAVGEFSNTSDAREIMDNIPTQQLANYFNNKPVDDCHGDLIQLLDSLLKNAQVDNPNTTTSTQDLDGNPSTTTNPNNPPTPPGTPSGSLDGENPNPDNPVPNIPPVNPNNPTGNNPGSNNPVSTGIPNLGGGGSVSQTQTANPQQSVSQSVTVTSPPDSAAEQELLQLVANQEAAQGSASTDSTYLIFGALAVVLIIGVAAFRGKGK